MKIEAFGDWLKRWPLVAILRGIKPGEALDIGTMLVETGFTIIEVPLNSPEPFASIVRLTKRLGDRVLVGAGTVTDWEQVTKIADAGGRVIVMPHADERVIEAAKRRNLFVVPGFATPTEAFRMINAGADAIWKLLGLLDGYITDYEPFKLVKTDKEKTENIIWNLLYGLYHIAYMLDPIMPKTAEKIFEHIGASVDEHNVPISFSAKNVSEPMFKRR